MMLVSALHMHEPLATVAAMLRCWRMVQRHDVLQLRILRVYKDNTGQSVTRRAKVSVGTAANGGLCGYNLQEGQKYLLKLRSTEGGTFFEEVSCLLPCVVRLSLRPCLLSVSLCCLHPHSGQSHPS